MADFDDLIPKSDDNPFADPFAGVGRPRSPDPWSLGASYYEHAPSSFEPSNDFNESYGIQPADFHDSLPTSVPNDTFPENTDTSTDPLEHSASQRAAPSSPAHSPPTPLSSIPHTSQDLRLASDTENEPTAAATTSDPDTSRTESFKSAIPPENVKAPPSSGGEALLQTPDRDLSPPSYISPPSQSDLHDESTPSPHNSQASTFASTAALGWDPISQPPHHKHAITSPLLPSDYQSTERSFNSLTLGGVAPGWGTALSPPETPSDSHGAKVSAIEADDEDDRPLGIPPNRDSRSALSPREGHQSSVASDPPLFHITVGDPQKVGDPINAHIVYTVSTRTTVPEFKKPSFSVLRRYSDFLWLFDALSSNNPGVIIPPVPEKMPFGRFAEGFIESRRLALTKCIQKIAAHPRLRKDPDLRLFLESDSFAMDIKHRKLENERAGLMASIGSSITGPKFYETDEWFDKKKSYLEALESQLRSLAKAIEAVAKQRSELITSITEFADAVKVLTSDLSQQLSSSLSVMADVERESRELLEVQSKQDLESISGTVEEYLRMIASVRLAFASRVKHFYTWKSAEAEKTRIRNMHEKTLRQRGLDRQSIIPLQREIEMSESKAQDSRAEYEDATKLIKLEVARFEHDRIVDFKGSLDMYLEGVISSQTKIINSWEQYQQHLLKRANTNSQLNAASMLTS